MTACHSHPRGLQRARECFLRAAAGGSMEAHTAAARLTLKYVLQNRS
jgi:hypothetical protein